MEPTNPTRVIDKRRRQCELRSRPDSIEPPSPPSLPDRLFIFERRLCPFELYAAPAAKSTPRRRDGGATPGSRSRLAEAMVRVARTSRHRRRRPYQAPRPHPRDRPLRRRPRRRRSLLRRRPRPRARHPRRRPARLLPPRQRHAPDLQPRRDRAPARRRRLPVPPHGAHGPGHVAFAASADRARPLARPADGGRRRHRGRLPLAERRPLDLRPRPRRQLGRVHRAPPLGRSATIRH